eukprot:scaffold1888_cov120-Cylindrotheca_fusiformis.AAC.4
MPERNQFLIANSNCYVESRRLQLAILLSSAHFLNYLFQGFQERNWKPLDPTMQLALTSGLIGVFTGLCEDFVDYHSSSSMNCPLPPRKRTSIVGVYSNVDIPMVSGSSGITDSIEMEDGFEDDSACISARKPCQQRRGR